MMQVSTLAWRKLSGLSGAPAAARPTTAGAVGAAPGPSGAALSGRPSTTSALDASVGAGWSEGEEGSVRSILDEVSAGKGSGIGSRV